MDSAHPSPDGPQPWTTLDRRHGDSLVLFRPRWDTLVHPRSHEPFERLVLEAPDWVNVVAVTSGGELVLVRQYRFGSATVTTEIPSGVVDPGEDHADTARRELREETGYTARRWTYLGHVDPNPAFLDNLCHQWLAEDAVLTDGQDLDPGEDIEVLTRSPEEVRDWVRDGRIDNALVLTALARVLDLRRGTS
ncbi:MAG: NUDIX hydrolase [Planctomycetota bacterium]|jgi:8-oxo-dGTP pyrophosphatase MutT (NUDIX family)|nr:NUDIX hydrolase [Planctomycetota bacterium]MDP6988644.1 NUDIX hydrolase [Planctomycetota bacterium]